MPTRPCLLGRPQRVRVRVQSSVWIPEPQTEDALEGRCLGNPGERVPEERDELLRWKVVGTTEVVGVGGGGVMMEAKQQSSLEDHILVLVSWKRRKEEIYLRIKQRDPFTSQGATWRELTLPGLGIG